MNRHIFLLKILDDAAAEKFIADNLHLTKGGTVDVPIPKGMENIGRIINPDGTFSQATHIRLVPSKSGVKSAFPIDPVKFPPRGKK